MAKDVILSKDLINVDVIVKSIENPALKEITRTMAEEFRKYQCGESTRDSALINLGYTNGLSRNILANINYHFLSTQRLSRIAKGE